MQRKFENHALWLLFIVYIIPLLLPLQLFAGVKICTLEGCSGPKETDQSDHSTPSFPNKMS